MKNPTHPQPVQSSSIATVHQTVEYTMQPLKESTDMQESAKQEKTKPRKSSIVYPKSLKGQPEPL